MKPIFKLTFILFLGIQSLKSYSQVNLNDIYQTGSTWSELHILERGMGQRDQTSYLIKIGSDTTINSVTYKKLNLKRMLIGSPNVVDYGTIGGIRVNSRQVYFIRTKTLPNTVDGNTEYQSFTINSFPLLNEITLYDFNLTQGTALSWKPNNSSVLSVGSVLVNNNQTLSTYTFWSQTPFHETWKEGIGSEQGFFGSNRSFNYINRFEPTCFSSPTLTYPVNCAIAPLSLAEDKSEGVSINFYPNPLNGRFLNIETPDLETIKQITIYNATGSVVFQKDLSKNSSHIETDLTTGFYFVNFIMDNGRSVTKKLLKH